MQSDVSRYTQFSQFRTTIRSSRDHLIVGIDVAKDKHHAFFGTADGKTLLRRLLFENNIQGYQKLMEKVCHLKSRYQLGQVVFGLEPTGNYHKPLASWLLTQGHALVLVTGKSVHDNRGLIDGRWDKNDTKDSANVADLISQGKCHFFEQPENRILALRNLLSVRKQLKKREHRLKMRIRNGLVVKYFPELDRLWGNCLAENLSIIRWYLDPAKIAATEFDQFVGHVTNKDRGVRQVRRLRAIHTAAKASVGMAVDSAARHEAKLLVEDLKRVREQLATTMEKIRTVCQPITGYGNLITIPGFGPYIAAVVLATIGDPDRFSHRKQILRLAGLDLNASRSGKTSHKAVPVISKRGNADLRYSLYQAALIGSYHNPYLRNLYQRMIKGREKERGIRTKMRVKLAAKLLVIAWVMLKTGQPFDPQRLAVESDDERRDKQSRAGR